jgi:predicted nuclease with TOPRIM domain
VTDLSNENEKLQNEAIDLKTKNEKLDAKTQELHEKNKQLESDMAALRTQFKTLEAGKANVDLELFPHSCTICTRKRNQGGFREIRYVGTVVRKS